MNERIRKFRRQMKWTQADFAAHVGVTRDVVASWENGRVEPPEAVIRLICREFDISYDWLKNGQEPMVVPKDALMLDKVDRILNGDNELMKAVFREMADLPPEAWKWLSRFVDCLYEANHAHDKP